MQDWRIDEKWEKEYGWYYKNMRFFKIRFPEFWQRAYKTKNNFFHYILADAEEGVIEPCYVEYLADDRVRKFWHMNCNFCMKEINTDINGDCYYSEDGVSWVCAECYNDFQTRFNWTATEIDDIPADNSSNTNS